MLLKLRTGNQKSRYQPIDSVSVESIKDLRRWAYWIRRHIYAEFSPRCILGGMVEYGHWIRSAYTPDYFPPDEKIGQTQRVMVFMPEDLFSVIFVQYVLDGDRRFKLKRLGLRRNEFQSRLGRAIEFYEHNKDVEFS
jgi:hypothetical protein